MSSTIAKTNISKYIKNKNIKKKLQRRSWQVFIPQGHVSFTWSFLTTPPFASKNRPQGGYFIL
jgi:hypothetical protein